MKLPLVNIANKDRTIYLFCRDKFGKLSIRKDTKFYPYYFEPDQQGEYKSYDGINLKKVFASKPQDIPKMRSTISYSSDIPFIKRYLIDKIDAIIKSKYKYCFIDIEVLANELPSYKDPKYTICCISAYNNFDEDIKTWFLSDYNDNFKNKEKYLLDDFVKYIKNNQFDIILGWNVNFDYRYLYNRYKYIFNKNFAKNISPINYIRSSNTDDIFYPAGISILDYMTLFKKVFMREPSYALNNIAIKYLEEPDWGETRFNTLTDAIKDKNINDISRLIKLEKKFNLLSYFDEIRVLSKCLWEDVIFNSYVIEMFVLNEAKEMGLVLPNKTKRDKKETFKGAIREAIELGDLYNISKVDLTSAYPSMIFNFCLDSMNIAQKGIKINNITFKQNNKALLPRVIKKMLTLKNDLKKQLNNTHPNSNTYKELKIKYDAIKGLVNSCFGVIGYEGFRIYDLNVVSAIAYLVRDLLTYVRNKLEIKGYKVVYFDTDSIFYASKEDLTPMLNDIIKDWALTRYNKVDINLQFDYEGFFTSIFILARCRYVGYLKTKSNAIIKEIKGVEIKRSNSSIYESYFQDKLIDKILNKESKYNIEQWIKEEKIRIKTLDLEYIAFPCKIQNKIYKNMPIFIRAYENTKKINSDFNINRGDLFYYIYVKTNDSNRNVLAFKKDDKDFINRDMIDWDMMIKRNIINKAEPIFDAKGWDKNNLYDDAQLKLF